MRVKHPDGDFKPEYVIPKIILQWIRNINRFDGVCYTSTHIKETLELPTAQMNFAFPAREMLSEGHCPRLREDFELTQPVSWQIASTLPGPAPGVASSGGARPATPPFSDFWFEPAQQFRTRYEQTTFGLMERYIAPCRHCTSLIAAGRGTGRQLNFTFGRGGVGRRRSAGEPGPPDGFATGPGPLRSGRPADIGAPSGSETGRPVRVASPGSNRSNTSTTESVRCFTVCAMAAGERHNG